MPPAGKRDPDPPTLEELLDGVDDDELAEFLEARRAASKGTGGGRGDRVTILEGKHADDWLKSFGIGDEEGDEKGNEKGGGGNVRRGFFDRR